MTETRKLAAILVSDVAGYSRLAGVDEDRTLARLRTLRSDLVDPTSLGAAVGMMMWMWISAIVILLSGELNAEIEHQTAKDSTVGSEKPLGERGAVMADTIGAAR